MVLFSETFLTALSCSKAKWALLRKLSVFSLLFLLGEMAGFECRFSFRLCRLFVPRFIAGRFRLFCRPQAASSEKLGVVVLFLVVVLVFSILLFEVGVRTWWIWGGIGVIEIRFLDLLKNIIQNHFRMKFFLQALFCLC